MAPRSKEVKNRQEDGEEPHSVPKSFHLFLSLSFPSSRLSRAIPGNHRARRRRKFIKYLKVRKRLLSPGAINFHLHFIFVSFATLDNGELRGPGTRWKGDTRGTKRPRGRRRENCKTRELYFLRDLFREQGCIFREHRIVWI